MSRFLYFVNDTGASLKINVTEKQGYRKDYKILEYIRQADYKKITKAQPYEWHPFLEWWVYIVMALSLFLVCVIVNYIVKRLNDVRMEERLVTLYEKTSRSTQVHGVLIEQETKKLPDISQRPSIGISMIFTKEENQKLTCFEEISIKIHEHESIEDKKLLKSKGNSVISIFKNPNFARSKILETSDKGNLCINSIFKSHVASASAHICSVSREPTISTDDMSNTKKSKSVDESEIDYFKGGNKQCIENTILKEVNTSQEVPPLSDLILAKNYQLDLEQAISKSTANNILSNKPSLMTIPKRTANDLFIKQSLIQIISSKILNKISSHREVCEAPIANVFNAEVLKDSSRNEESKSDLENYIARTVIELMQDILEKLELLEIVNSIEKNFCIPESRE